jgi:hypothetical protein
VEEVAEAVDQAADEQGGQKPPRSAADTEH